MDCGDRLCFEGDERSGVSGYGLVPFIEVFVEYNASRSQCAEHFRSVFVEDVVHQIAKELVLVLHFGLELLHGAAAGVHAAAQLIAEDLGEFEVARFEGGASRVDAVALGIE